MPEHVVCPACFDGACSECTGAGCYCDCQMPGDDYPGCDLHDDLDECEDCGGCRECGNCFCDEEEYWEDADEN